MKISFVHRFPLGKKRDTDTPESQRKGSTSFISYYSDIRVGWLLNMDQSQGMLPKRGFLQSKIKYRCFSKLILQLMAVVLCKISIPKIEYICFYQELFQAAVPGWLVSVYIYWDSSKPSRAAFSEKFLLSLNIKVWDMILCFLLLYLYLATIYPFPNWNVKVLLWSI